MKIRAVPTAIAVTDHDAAFDGLIARPGQPALDQKPVQRCKFQLEHMDTRVWAGNLPQYRRNRDLASTGVQVSPETGEIGWLGRWRHRQ